MKTNKMDATVGKIFATVVLLATIVAVPYLAHTGKQQALENSMAKAITCIESSFCVNYKQLGSSTEWYDGELHYEAIGKEHQTKLGNADFYRVKLADDSYFFRVDGSKHLVMQYFQVGEDVSESELIARYDIY